MHALGVRKLSILIGTENENLNVAKFCSSRAHHWILLAALPGAIATLVRTGDPYLFSKQFFEDMLARLSGTGRLRFILQPTVALFIGMRDGIKDSREDVLLFVSPSVPSGAQDRTPTKRT
jgi:hypothetical protein